MPSESPTVNGNKFIGLPLANECMNRPSTNSFTGPPPKVSPGPPPNGGGKVRDMARTA